MWSHTYLETLEILSDIYNNHHYNLNYILTCESKHQTSFISRLGPSDTARLHMYLQERANTQGTYMLPVRNTDDVITLRFGLRLIQVGVKEQDNVLTISAWVRQVIWKSQFKCIH